jgi:transaldolase
LDNITRGILDDRTLERYVRELSVTGLTSNPTIFDAAIKKGTLYDQAIEAASATGASDESIFFGLAIEDLVRAADLFRGAFDRTHGSDGWVSLEVSPLLAHLTAGTIKEAALLRRRVPRPNLLIKIPGTVEGLAAIEESIFDGVSVNVTLLFSSEQYVAAAEAFMRGLERRIQAGLDPRVDSVASLFVSRWDVAVQDQVPLALRNRLGIAVAGRTYRDYCRLLDSPRWRTLAAAGARPQRLLWASTGTKDAEASDTLYVEALAAPGTINTIPEKTLVAFAEHGQVAGALPVDGKEAEKVLAEFAAVGIDDRYLAERLQFEGIASFVRSWQDLLRVVASKRPNAPEPGVEPRRSVSATR